MIDTGKLSRRHMENAGYIMEKAEHYNSYSNRMHDMFGFIDYICIGNGHTIGLQTTSKSHMSDHRKKILGEPRHKIWKDSGNLILLHGWEAVPNGKRNKYVLHEEWI